jgi:steroid 5-alpha reductase family enzyme|tara:strand:- start:519 stop:1370 length:852 start_codon:yes stop_codon:yes gene_type:complete
MKPIHYLSFAALGFIIPFGISLLIGNPLVQNIVLAIYIIQWIAFIPAYVFQTEKFFDLTGSITYSGVFAYLIYLTASGSINANWGSTVIAVCVILWAGRLGTFLFSRIAKDGEDKRFRTIKPSPSQFFMTWTLQGAWVSLCSLCAITGIASDTGIIINPIFYIGLFMFIGGFAIEIIADQQKTIFRAIPENRDKFITTGLWSRSRHPNYFGEIALWTGVALMSFSSLSGIEFLTLISPIWTYLLLVKISGVRMLEGRGSVKWGDNKDYISYIENTPMVFIKFW